MVEDQSEGIGGVGLLGAGGSAFVPGSYALSENFKGQLRQVQDEELRLFEQKLKNARPADLDLFGIKRRYCEVCNDQCSGYEPTKVLFGGRGEFPTFCKHCNCPAHFHKVEEEIQ